MPSATTGTYTVTYTSASSIPEDVWGTLKSIPLSANVILPHATKCLHREQSGHALPSNQVWMTCTSYTPRPSIEFILSCTESDMGTYPIFIVNTRPISQLPLRSCMFILAQALHKCVPASRVYSVFAPDPVAQTFTEIWTQLTGIKRYIEPYYAAKLTFCNGKTFINRSMTIHPELTYELRPAVARDVAAVAELCLGFSLEGVSPYILCYDTMSSDPQL